MLYSREQADSKACNYPADDHDPEPSSERLYTASDSKYDCPDK